MFKKISLLAVAFLFYANSFAQNNVISINYIDELAKIGEEGDYPLSGNYILLRDLDFNDPASYINPALITTYTTGEGWQGIPSTTKYLNNIFFRGTFNGNNHIIKNLYISASIYAKSQNRGLFSGGADCTIKNLGVVNINISNVASAGGLLRSIAGNCVIDNCYVTGKLFASNINNAFIYENPIGGLVGTVVNSTGTTAKITNCYTNVYIAGYSGTGALIGVINSTNATLSIKNCYTSGNIEVLNAANYGLFIGKLFVGNMQPVLDSIINCYTTVKPINMIPANRKSAQFIGEIENIGTATIKIIIKGCFGLSSEKSIINDDPGVFSNFTISDTVFTGSLNRNFSPLTTTPAYSNTYLYNATDQQYPLLKKTDGTLLDGQRVVYPPVIIKSNNNFNSYVGSVTPIDNLTKNLPVTYSIVKINGVAGFNPYISINLTNGTLSWIETIPAGNYSVEVYAANGTETNTSWVQLEIIKPNNALTNVNAQSVRFTASDTSFANSDFIVIDSLNLINRNYTIETWAKLEGSINNWKRIFDFARGANPSGILLGFPFADKLGYHANGGDRIITFPSGFNPRAWNHYALTLKDTLLSLYINGELVDSYRGNKSTIGYNKNYLGKSNFPDSSTAGRFSECRIWLQAKSADEIRAYYNKLLPSNADSLYVYLPLTSNIYGRLSINNDALNNSSINNYGFRPSPYLHRKSNFSMYYIYDSSQQYVYGSINSFLEPGETIQIAIKDSLNSWIDVPNVSGYFFSYKLPENFISGNIYVRSRIGVVNTNRFGNYYAASTYYVDWVGTNLRVNPNISFKTIYPGSNAIFIQRNKTNNPYTILNPIIANTTDATQKIQPYSVTPYISYYSTSTNMSRPLANHYSIGIIPIYFYFPQGDSSNARIAGIPNLAPEHNKDIRLVNINGNNIITVDNKAPSGSYNIDLQLYNSLNATNIGVDSAGNTFSYLNLVVVLADSLKAVKYASKNYVNTAFKTVKSGIPVIIGNDSVVKATRYQILVRRNGVDITNLYTLNQTNFDVSTEKRPVGVDSVFLTYIGWFNEVLKDTLLFSFTYTKPSIKYAPNVSDDISLVNGLVGFNPLVLDSGGKTLTYRLLNANANFTVSPQTGKITVVNWGALTAAYTATLTIEASNGTYKDTATFTYTKNAQNRVLYYSNSSYRTQSTNGADYIQLPSIDLRNKAFGMDIWYKHNAKVGNNHRVIDIGTGGNNQGVIFMFPDSTQLFVRTPNQSDYYLSIPAGVNIRNWNHYIISVSSTGVASFFINGKLIFNRTGGGTTPQTIFTSNFLGRSNYGGGDAPSLGQFTDFRVWDSAIDSTVYNTRGINYFTTNTGANIIFYLPLSVPVFNSNVNLTNNYRLVNKAAVGSTAVLDSIAYIIGNSNMFNFDPDRIFLAGQSSTSSSTKTITINNYASVTDTNTKTPVNTVATINKSYYWGVILPPSQGTYLNNQIISINDNAGVISNVNYKYIVKYLPNTITYLPGDSVQVFTTKAGFVLPRNDFWLEAQKPRKYIWVDSGGLNNIGNFQLDTVTGKFSWQPIDPIEAVYPIKINVTNEVGTNTINCQVLLSDSLGFIQYPIDSLSVNYGNDSSSIPYTAGITSSTKFSITSVPNNGAITINPQNGRIYWNTQVSAGLYTLKVQASNFINTITKTIKLNIQLIAPTGLSYQPKNYTIVNTGFDTSTTYINTPIINTGGGIKFTANTPNGCRIDSNTGAINCKNTLVSVGNYNVVVNAQNTQGFVKDSININVIATSKDSILGYKNAYFTLNTDATYKNGDYIALPSVYLPNNFSIEAWVKLKDITRNYQQIFDAGKTDNNHIVSIGTVGTTGRLFISIPTVASGNASNDIWDTAIVPRIANNTWFHIAYIKKGVNVKLYLNGRKIIDTSTSVISYNDSITRVYFGATNFGNQSMLGQLDECRIWKRALTEYEINRYKTVFLTPQDDSLYVYLPLQGSLVKDTSIPAGTVIKNSATGASALTRPITVVGNGMKMSRDTNRQIVYGTHDSTTTMQKTITVKTHFYNQLPSSDSTTTAVKYGNHWATENKKIPPIFVLGTLQVSKSMNENFNPNPFYVYYAPTGLTYNNLNTFNITQSTTPYTTNKPIIYTNYDSNNLLYSINPAYTGISIHPTTGIITIYSDTVFKLYGKKIIPTITAQSGLGKTSTAVTLNIINTYIIGYNNTSVCLPNSNGADYIRIPSVDLRNSNFAIETWFKLMGSPTSNKRIFDFAPGTTGNDRSGLILYFPVNKIKLGAFNEDGLIDLGNADTVLKNGLNEWNKYSVFYNATTKTYYVYINGVLKKMATVSTDKYTAPLISNFLANNNYADPVTDGYFREFKIYKNVSYADFIKNLSYNILPNRPDNTLYYYLPLSNNVNNSTYIGNITINNNTALTNKALMYNPNALNNNATLISANNRAFYYGDSINQIITGEFVDQTNRLRFSYTNGVIKDTILPNVAIEKYSWQVRGKNISGKFKVYSSVSTQYADSIQVLLIPYKLNYASNNRGYPIIAGNSGTPTFIGSEPILFSIDSGNATGFSINANTGVISWGNTIASGFYKLRVLASNAVGTSNFTYSVNIQDTLQGFSYTPDSVIVSGYNADSLPFLPNLTKGTGVTFSILNPTTGFSINANNGRLYWTNTVANGVYKIRVRANNVYNLPLTDTVTIILTTQAPYNLKYLQDTMVFSQGVNIQTPKPSINRGGLPTIFTISNITPSGANIRIDSLTGEIKWASNTLGTYTITVVATNSLGFVSKTIQITILSAANIALDYNNASLTLGVLFAGNTNNNRIELPNLDLRGAGYTIETWARSLNAVGVGNWRRIFDFGTGQNYDGVILGFQSATTLGVHASTGEDYIFNFPLNFNALNWNHYAVTVSDSVRLYVNGVLLGTARANKPSVIFNKNYLNFSNWVGDAAGLNAYQECRIWKYARSGADIAQNYQGSVPNDAFGLYYYLPFKQTGYIPGVIINPTNFVLAPEAGLFMGSPYYTSNIANTAVNSILTDSSKIWAVVPNSVVLNTNQVSELIPYYKTDSTRQKIQGYYAGTLAAGEVLQYSIDTGRTWKKIGFVQDNNWIQTIDTGFKFGQIKIRSIINNIVTNRQFNDIDVVVYPNPPINLRATALNDGTVTLQFIPPVVNATITGYKIYSQAGVLVGTATQSPAIITGLNNGQAYQFNVSSINSKGESPLSTISNSIIVVNNILQISTSTNTIDGVSITPTTNVTAYTNFRVTYQIKTGYKLDSIYINNVRNRDSIFGSVTFLNINSSQRVQVYASKIPFTLTITKNSGGVITSNQVVSPIQSTITTYYGDTLTIQFIPDNRYKVDSVFINGMYNADVKSSYTFTNIQENNTVRVVFKAKVYKKITLEIVGNGTATASVGEIEVEEGTTYRLTYMAAIGHLLDSVLVDGVLKNDSVNGYTFNNITSDIKIRLVFKIKTFTITALVKNGTVTPSGITTYNYGTNVRYNFSPINNLYVLDSLLIDGELQFNPDTTIYTFDSLKADHTIQIVFNLKANVKYTININKSEGVTVTPATSQQVGYGGSLQITWVANIGYVLDSIFVNGFYNRDSINGYTFTNVRGAQSIYIKFKIKTFTIVSTAGLHGTINPLGLSVVNYGTNKTYILTPDVGYQTDSLIINGTSVNKPSDNIYTFNNVTANQTIRVTFKIATINPNPCTGTKQTPNIVRVGDALKSDITSFAIQRWYLGGAIKDSTTNNTYTPTDAGVYTLLGVDATGCESNISKKYYYAKTCITPAGRLGNGAYIQTDIIGNANIMVIKWCTDLMQGEVRVQVLDINGELIEDKKIPSSFGTYILNKQQIQSKKYIIKVMDNKGEIIQISDVVNNF